MDELAEMELFEAVSGLGNYHLVNEVMRYLVQPEDCLNCLRDLIIALKHDDLSHGYVVHLKLGEWKILANHVIPLFTSYRENVEISALVLQVLVLMTSRIDNSSPDLFKLLTYLQDYKEAFVKKDIFVILMTMLVTTLEQDEDAADEDAKPRMDTQEVFDSVLMLMCNLVSVPDPRPGDAGYTPTRAQLQLIYIHLFHEQGLFDFLILLTETIESEHNAQQAWALLDILYHLCTRISPELVRKGTGKDVLSDLIERDRLNLKACRPTRSRHARFGTAIEARTEMGGAQVSSSLLQQNKVSKGTRVIGREFHDATRSTQKQNMFHDPLFVDLEEGSVRDHNQLNPFLRAAEEATRDIEDATLIGLQKFFRDFLQTSFTPQIRFLRSTLLSDKLDSYSKEYKRPRLLNFVSWILEFHRLQHTSAVTQAKKAKEATIPTVDIASIQGAIDLDMIQFVTSRLREYGKGSNFHASHSVIVLRVLSQQLKVINVVSDSPDEATVNVGDILTQHLVKEDVLSHLVWFMKNYKSRVHDPRVLSYSLEVFHLLSKLMTKLSERKGQSLEFQVERTYAVRMTRTTTTLEKEIDSLADAHVVENLFHLLEKYKKLSPQLNSILVKLLYQIIKMDPTNIVVFFELPYFLRIHRIMSDPLMREKKQAKKYEEMTTLLRYILRQFFKCAEKNSLVFVELLFRKVRDSASTVLASHRSEFAAILDNYNDQHYKEVLDRMEAGETLNIMKARRKAELDGNAPWTEEEDAFLRERCPLFSDHPLCAELLAAELPDDSRRTARQIRKRLVELGLTGKNATGTDSNTRDTEVPSYDQLDLEENPAKRQKLSNNIEELNPIDHASVEADLERLLDAWVDNAGDTFQDTFTNTYKVETGIEEKLSHMETKQQLDIPNGNCNASLFEPELDLEMELEKMMEEGITEESVGICTQTQVDGVHSGVFGGDLPNIMEASVAGGSTLAEDPFPRDGAQTGVAGGSPLAEDLLPRDGAQTTVDMFAETASQVPDSWNFSQDVSSSQQVPPRTATAAEDIAHALDTELEFMLTTGFQNADPNAGAGQEMDSARWELEEELGLEDELALEEDLERIMDDAAAEAP